MAEELKLVTELAITVVGGLCLVRGIGFCVRTAIGWLWDHWMRFTYHFTDTVETRQCTKPLMGYPKVQISTK